MKQSRRDLLELGLTLKEAQACLILAYRFPYLTGYAHEMRKNPDTGHIYSAVVVDIEKLYNYTSTRRMSNHAAKLMKSVNAIVEKAYTLYKQGTNYA